jgi:hypothetical protein
MGAIWRASRRVWSGCWRAADAAGVNLAALTGENAAENNALFMLAIPYVITAISVGITAYEIYDLYQEIEAAGGDEAAAREVLAGRLQEWYNGDGLLLAIIESAFPGLKVAGKTVDQIKEALEKLGGNPLEPLSSAMAGVSPTLANMVDAKVQSSVAKGELPSGLDFQFINKAGKFYPDVPDLRTGLSISFPTENLERVPREQRVDWNSNAKAAFIKEWYDRGYEAPRGGWSEYDIHHIQPREFGGSNDFWNLTPVQRTTHQKEFNEFWRGM